MGSRLLGYLLLSAGTVLATVAVAPVPETEAALEGELRALAEEALATVPGARETAPWLADRPEDLGRELQADLDAVRALAGAETEAGMATRLRAALEGPGAELAALLDAGPGADPEAWRAAVEKTARVLVRRLQAAWPDFPRGERFGRVRRLGRGLDAGRRRLRVGLEALGPAAAPLLSRLEDLDARIDARQAAVAHPLGNPVWSLFGLGIFLMVAGIVTARRAGRRAGAEEHTAALAGVADRALGELVEGTRRLVETLDTVDDASLHRALDALQEGPAFDLVENRASLRQRLGLGSYAEFMAQFAIGERLLNRAWTALADGYGDEARRSLREALPFLEDARRLAGGPPAPGG